MWMKYEGYSLVYVVCRRFALTSLTPVINRRQANRQMSGIRQYEYAVSWLWFGMVMRRWGDADGQQNERNRIWHTFNNMYYVSASNLPTIHRSPLTPSSFELVSFKPSLRCVDLPITAASLTTNILDLDLHWIPTVYRFMCPTQRYKNGIRSIYVFHQFSLVSVRSNVWENNKWHRK